MCKTSKEQEIYKYCCFRIPVIITNQVIRKIHRIELIIQMKQQVVEIKVIHNHLFLVFLGKHLAESGIY